MTKETLRRGLGSAESRILSDLASEGRVIFSIDELSKKTSSRPLARKMASTLSRKKWVERLSRGLYLILELAAGSKPEWSEDSFYIASKLARPYYLGYLSMLHYYSWTEQVPNTISVVTTKITTPKIIHGTKYEFVTLSKKKFFGYKETNIRGHTIVVSDPEKTLVDALDHPEYCGGIDEVKKAIVYAKVDWGKVITYAERMGNGAIYKRMGFLLEEMGVPISKEIIEDLRGRLTTGYAPLYPTAGNTGKYNTRWNIQINTDISRGDLE
ncbi:MAG: type IV toxin-antitoxin system AbiEi family antitoxin [Candidatus Diapherotrites archaeon]